jgi:hypothetical protein
MDHGGIFIWEEDGAADHHMICPTHNALVLNDRKLFHRVTPVSMEAPEPRVTLQIWGI